MWYVLTANVWCSAWVIIGREASRSESVEWFNISNVITCSTQLSGSSDIGAVKYIDLKIAIDQILILVAMVNPTRAEMSGDDDTMTTADNMVTLATGISCCD